MFSQFCLTNIIQHKKFVFLQYFNTQDNYDSREISHVKYCYLKIFIAC